MSKLYQSQYQSNYFKENEKSTLKILDIWEMSFNVQEMLNINADFKKFVIRFKDENSKNYYHFSHLNTNNDFNLTINATKKDKEKYKKWLEENSIPVSCIVLEHNYFNAYCIIKTINKTFAMPYILCPDLINSELNQIKLINLTFDVFSKCDI
jgi:hypothetical protein